MWAHEHTAETATSPEAIWQVLRDLDQWATWDPSLEWVRLQGPFQPGAQVVMKPKGQDPITSVIVQATEHRVYADQTDLGGVVLRFSHTLAPLAASGPGSRTTRCWCSRPTPTSGGGRQRHLRVRRSAHPAAGGSEPPSGPG